VAGFFGGASLFSLGRRWGFGLSFFAPPGKRRRSFCCWKKCQALNYINTICVREDVRWDQNMSKLCPNLIKRRKTSSREQPPLEIFTDFSIVLPVLLISANNCVAPTGPQLCVHTERTKMLAGKFQHTLGKETRNFNSKSGYIRFQHLFP
jgi:hypothetical protein